MELKQIKNGFVIFFSSMVISTHASDVEKGRKLYESKCVSCHGKLGEGKESQKAPRIAGQHAWYLKTQLENFHTLKRNNPKMMPFIKNLSPQDFEDLSAFISQIPPQKPSTPAANAPETAPAQTH